MRFPIQPQSWLPAQLSSLLAVTATHWPTKEHIACHLVCYTCGYSKAFWIQINLKWVWNQKNWFRIYTRLLTSTKWHNWHQPSSISKVNMALGVKFRWHVNSHLFSILCINRSFLLLTAVFPWAKAARWQKWTWKHYQHCWSPYGTFFGHALPLKSTAWSSQMCAGWSIKINFQ